jgi:hypothetical protein
MAKYCFLTIHKATDCVVHFRCIAKDGCRTEIPSRSTTDEIGTSSTNKYAAYCWAGILVDAGMLMVEHHLGSPKGAGGGDRTIT